MWIYFAKSMMQIHTSRDFQRGHFKFENILLTMYVITGQPWELVTKIYFLSLKISVKLEMIVSNEIPIKSLSKNILGFIASGHNKSVSI